MAWSILQKNGLIRHSRNLSHPVITHPNGFEPRQLGTVASSWNNFAAPQPIQGCWISGLKISWLDWNNFAAPQSNLQVREDQKKWYAPPYLSHPGFALIAVPLDNVTYTYVSIPIVA